MELVAISENVMINPEKIDSLELRKLKKNEQLILTINGKAHFVKVDVGELLNKLKIIGIDASDQFFAG